MQNSNTGKLISKLRKEKGLTQQELGTILGVSPKTISKWECNNGLPDIIYLKEISKVLEITIEELLNGKINNREENKITNKSKNITIIILIVFTLVILVTIIIITSNNNNNNKEFVKDNCTVIRTYYIDNISKSNNENYLYITMHEYQVEGIYTIKLPVTISRELEIGSSYEFTFKTTKEYSQTTTDKLFNNSEIINLKYSNKVGLERTNTFDCNET